MNELTKIIAQTTGSKNSRQATAGFIMAHSELLNNFISICFEIQNPDHYKACWVMELIAYEKLDWFQEYLDLICSKSKMLTNESAIRPLSKVIFLLIETHYKNAKNEIHFTEAQREELVEINFDWLITDTKVATKVYVMRSLQLLGKEHNWIHHELRIILEKDYNNHSAAYKAVAREILKKLK